MDPYKLPRFPAYIAKRKCGIEIPKRSYGAYFIFENEVLIYIGYSGSDLKKALYRHFQVWNDHRNSWIDPSFYPPYDRPTYVDLLKINNYTVSAIITQEKLDGWELEKHYIKEYLPRDNKEKYFLYFVKYERLTPVFEDLEEQISSMTNYDDIEVPF